MSLHWNRVTLDAQRLWVQLCSLLNRKATDCAWSGGGGGTVSVSKHSEWNGWAVLRRGRCAVTSGQEDPVPGCSFPQVFILGRTPWGVAVLSQKTSPGLTVGNNGFLCRILSSS